MKERLKQLGSKRIFGFTYAQMIILAVIIVSLFSFGESSLRRRYRYEKQIKELRSQINYYKEQAEVNSKKLEELKSEKEDLEKFARENYIMKRENEDLFILE